MKMRNRMPLEHLGLWEELHNPDFKGGDFDPLLAMAYGNQLNLFSKLYGRAVY